jgi:hypothetical protein
MNGSIINKLFFYIMELVFVTTLDRIRKCLSLSRPVFFKRVNNNIKISYKIYKFSVYKQEYFSKSISNTTEQRMIILYVKLYMNVINTLIICVCTRFVAQGFLKMNGTEVIEFITTHIFNKPRKKRKQRKQ